MFFGFWGIVLTTATADLWHDIHVVKHSAIASKRFKKSSRCGDIKLSKCDSKSYWTYQELTQLSDRLLFIVEKRWESLSHDHQLTLMGLAYEFIEPKEKNGIFSFFKSILNVVRAAYKFLRLVKNQELTDFQAFQSSLYRLTHCILDEIESNNVTYQQKFKVALTDASNELQNRKRMTAEEACGRIAQLSD